MKKTDVYVVVDTPKKAKKLKKVFCIFDIEWHINQFYGDFNYFYFEDDDLYSIKIKPGLSKVSIKELRNILAKEHLKEGDVCLFEDKGYKVLGRYKQYSNVFKDFVCDKIEGNSNTTTGFHNFIRYATEEEKALLDPKKELAIGKWYKTKSVTSIFFLTEIQGDYRKNKGYGLLNNNEWFDNRNSACFMGRANDLDNFTEANPKEVEQALIEEAKRRYNVGDKLSKVRDDHADDNRFFESHSFGLENNCLYFDSTNGSNYSYCIFDNGQWATIIKQDKLSNLKEAYNNGYCVEFYDVKADKWKRHEHPCWNTNLQWRIMVNNGHLVVSDVYLLKQIKELKKSIEEIKSNIK